MSTVRNPAKVYFVPTAADVKALRAGHSALDCFGKYRQVVKVAVPMKDVEGKWFVRFETEFGPHSTMTGSYKEGELVRTTALSAEHKSVELDAIEREINRSHTWTPESDAWAWR